GQITVPSDAMQNAGTATIVLNANTCYGQDDPTVGIDMPFYVYGRFSGGTCAAEGYINGFAQEFAIRPGYVLQIPAGTTLTTNGTFDIDGIVENSGHLVNQAVFENGIYRMNTGLLSVRNRLVNSGTVTNRLGGTLSIWPS